MPWKNPADHVAYQKRYNREHQDEQVARNRARRQALREYGKSALEGKDVDHITPLDQGGGTGKSNLRLRSIASNRGFKRDAKNNPL